MGVKLIKALSKTYKKCVEYLEIMPEMFPEVAVLI